MLKIILKLITNFYNSWRGLKAASKQWSFRFELVIFILSIPLTIWLGRTTSEYALLISSVIMVLVVELLNSAIEAVIDRIGLEHHPLSGLAKDLGSAAVLIAFVNAAVIWGMILSGRLGYL